MRVPVKRGIFPNANLGVYQNMGHNIGVHWPQFVSMPVDARPQAFFTALRSDPNTILQHRAQVVLSSRTASEAITDLVQVLTKPAMTELGVEPIALAGLTTGLQPQVSEELAPSPWRLDIPRDQGNADQVEPPSVDVLLAAALLGCIDIIPGAGAHTLLDTNTTNVRLIARGMVQLLESYGAQAIANASEEAGLAVIAQSYGTWAFATDWAQFMVDEGYSPAREILPFLRKHCADLDLIEHTVQAFDIEGLYFFDVPKLPHFLDMVKQLPAHSEGESLERTAMITQLAHELDEVIGYEALDAINDYGTAIIEARLDIATMIYAQLSTPSFDTLMAELQWYGPKITGYITTCDFSSFILSGANWAAYYRDFKAGRTPTY